MQQPHAGGSHLAEAAAEASLKLAFLCNSLLQVYHITLSCLLMHMHMQLGTLVCTHKAERSARVLSVMLGSYPTIVGFLCFCYQACMTIQADKQLIFYSHSHQVWMP